MKVILCRGIGEPANGRTMLHGVVDFLPKSWQVVNQQLKPEYGFVGGPFFGQSFANTYAEGYRALMEELEKGPAIVLGYSAGAAFAGAVKHRNVIAVGLLADPFQPVGVSSNGKYGLAGSRANYHPKVKWVYDPTDMICQSPADSPIRTIADQTSHMSFANINEWVTDLVSRLTTGRWQAVRRQWWNPLAVSRQYSEAISGAIGYLKPGGDHTSYQVRRQSNGKTYTQNLAEWVIAQSK